MEAILCGFSCETVPHRLIHLNAQFSADGIFGQDYGCGTTVGDVLLRVGFKISKAFLFLIRSHSLASAFDQM